MLVYVEQEYAVTWHEKTKVWDGPFKYHYEDYWDYDLRFENFVCDESDVDEMKLSKISEYAERIGCRFVFEIPEGHYYSDRPYYCKTKITYIKDFPMYRATHELTCGQFAQFLKEIE